MLINYYYMVGYLRLVISQFFLNDFSVFCKWLHTLFFKMLSHPFLSISIFFLFLTPSPLIHKLRHQNMSNSFWHFWLCTLKLFSPHKNQHKSVNLKKNENHWCFDIYKHYLLKINNHYDPLETERETERSLPWERSKKQ